MQKDQMIRKGKLYKNYIFEFIKDNFDYVGSVSLSILIKVIFIIFYAYPLRVTGDELFLFYLPAKLAGMDWTSSMENYRYYGYGFSIFLTPLFKLISNPIILYKLILIIVSIFQAVIPAIVCYLSREFFHIRDRKFNLIVALVCTFMVSTTNCYMYNEHIYIIGVWACFLFISKLFNSKNRMEEWKYSGLLVIAMLWSLTMHSRAITLILGYVVLYVISFIFFKKKLGSIIQIVFCYGVGYWIHTKIMSWNNELLIPKSNQNNGIVANTTVNIDVSNIDLFDVEYIKAIFRIVISQINAINMLTGGLVLFSLIIAIYMFFRLMRMSNNDYRYLILFLFGIICTVITIGGQAVSWGVGVRYAYTNNDNSADALRALMYLRYFMAYTTPMMMVLLCYLKNNSGVVSKLWKYTVLLSYTICFIWLKWVVPLVAEKSTALLAAWAFKFDYLFSTISFQQYAISVFFFLVVLLIFSYLMRKQNIKVLLICLLLITLYKYCFSAICMDYVIEKQNYNACNASNAVMKQIADMDYDIYVQHRSIPMTGQGTRYQLQFLNPGIEIKAGLPTGEENSVYFCFEGKENANLIELGYSIYSLDDNEFIYIKDEKIKNMIIKD